jgi:membrane associated rhomboid family serine protease
VNLTPHPAARDVETREERIGPLANPNEVRELTLVLSSMAVPFEVREESGAWIIVVLPRDLPRALENIRLYRTENRNWPPKRSREVLPYARGLVAPLVSLALLVFYGVTGPTASGSPWTSHGAAVCESILHGQIWRAATALTLHGNVEHVLGNAIAGAVFLSAANRRLGAGRGTLLVLLSGTLGNVLNAIYHRTGHVSIGASTAVFGAVGVLVATQLAANRNAPVRSLTERIAPVLGGLALLGLLGADPGHHTDLMAHLFGLVAGIALGLPFLVVRRPLGRTRPWLQPFCGALAVVVVAVSWALAWRVNRFLW